MSAARRSAGVLVVVVVIALLVGQSVVGLHQLRVAPRPAALPTSTDGAGGPIAFVASWPHPRLMAAAVPPPPVPTDIYTVAPDGSGLRRLTTDGAPKDLLAWSPDGSALAYTVNPLRQVWTIGATGADRRLLCAGCVAIDGSAQLAWAPDGRTLAARSPTGVVLIDARTGAPTSVRVSPSVVGIGWSPDGRSLAVTISNRGLAVLDVATHRVRFLDRAPAAGPVAWSPDGGRIAFATVRQGRYRLYGGVVSFDTRTGAGRPLLAARSTNGVYGLSWSPAGRTLAVVYHPIYPPTQALLTVSRNGSVVRTISVCEGSGSAAGSCPSGNVVAWSPDGARLLVEDIASAGAGRSLLVLTRSGAATRVSGPLQPVWGIGWSPA